MAFGSGYPAYKSGGWVDYNTTATIYCKYNGNWVRPGNNDELPQVWTRLNGNWYQIYYKKEKQTTTTVTTTINNNSMYLWRSKYSNWQQGKAGQGFFDGYDRTTGKIVHPGVYSTSFDLNGSAFSGTSVSSVTGGTVSFDRTASGYYNRVNTLCFKRNASFKNTSAWKDNDIMCSFSIPANGPNSHTDKAFDSNTIRTDLLADFINNQRWLYLSNNERDAGGNVLTYSNGQKAYFSNSYMKANNFKISLTFTKQVTMSSFSRDESISPFSTKSDDNYLRMYVYEDEIGMSLSEVLKHREENNIPDIDPDNTFFDTELDIYHLGERFIDDTFELAFPNVYENYQKVFISYIDPNEDDIVRKEMLIHPTRGKHFALVPDYVNEVTVNVVDTKAMMMLYNRTFRRDDI